MPPIYPDRALRTSLHNSMIAGALGMFFFIFVQNGPLPLMLEKLGAGGIAIGMTAALFQLGMLVQIPSAFYTERLSTRKPFWAITTSLARASMAVPGIFLLISPDQGSVAIWLTLGAIGVFSFLAQMSAPAWFSWMAELVPDDMRADFWSKRQGVVMIASLFSVAMIGWFLDLFPAHSFAGFGWLLILAAVTGVLDIVVHWFVIEPPISQPNRALSIRKRIFQPLENRNFLYFTLAMCVWFFGLGFFAPFMNVYLKTTFGISYTHLSSIQLAGMISSVVSSFLGGRIIKRVGLRTFGLAMVVMIPLFSVVWFFLDGNSTGLLPILGRVPQPVMLLCISSLLAGGVFAAVGLLQLNLLATLSPKEGTTMAMAVHWTLIGTLSALGPIVGGWVKDWYTAHPTGIQLYAGTEFSYFQIMIIAHNLMIWLLVLPLLMKIRKTDGEWPVQRAVADIFVLTPLRSVRNAYSFNLAASSVTVNTVKETASAAGKIAAKAARETGTIALRAVKETVEAASRAGKESVEKEKRKRGEKKNDRTD
ncbi:MFS transporter [Pontiellaceae bacterium B12227]|nr:MFS transporter [Pontiellaceae bacterium B12227]